MAEQVNDLKPEKAHTVKEISKTQIGRVILKECGNEGTEQKANLRRLLQGVIDNFKEGPAVRGNAEIRVSDNFGYSVRIVSGNGEYKYVVLMNGSGEIELIPTGSPSRVDRIKKAIFDKKPEKTHNVCEISETEIGRVILKECGNEGTQNSVQKANLRRILQGVIDKFKEGPAVCGNAEIRVSDNFGYLRIVSGKGENKYEVKMNQSGEIILTKNASQTTWSWKTLTNWFSY